MTILMLSDIISVMKEWQNKLLKRVLSTKRGFQRTVVCTAIKGKFLNFLFGDDSKSNHVLW